MNTSFKRLGISPPAIIVAAIIVIVVVGIFVLPKFMRNDSGLVPKQTRQNTDPEPVKITGDTLQAIAAYLSEIKQDIRDNNQDIHAELQRIQRAESAAALPILVIVLIFATVLAFLFLWRLESTLKSVYERRYVELKDELQHTVGRMDQDVHMLKESIVESGELAKVLINFSELQESIRGLTGRLDPSASGKYNYERIISKNAFGIENLGRRSETPAAPINLEKMVMERTNRLYEDNNLESYKNDLQFVRVQISNMQDMMMKNSSEDAGGKPIFEKQDLGHMCIIEEKINNYIVPVFHSTNAFNYKHRTGLDMVFKFSFAESQRAVPRSEEFKIVKIVKPGKCEKMGPATWKLVDKGEIQIEYLP
ncbi:MAG TPA: hypothetical protein VMX58_09705 [Patescibacteria group bacterium]|nr:hypothetical protein [Patescibacteria group bacterium]